MVKMHDFQITDHEEWVMGRLIELEVKKQVLADFLEMKDQATDVIELHVLSKQIKILRKEIEGLLRPLEPL